MSDARIHAIPLPTPFPVGPILVYLLVGDRPTLVDTGVHGEASWGALVEGLAAHGLRVADLERVVVTHGHVDHYGQARRIREASGAEVIAHPRTAPLVATYPFTRETVRRNTADFLRSHGTPAGVVERVLASQAAGAALQEPLELDRTVESGERIEVGPDLALVAREVSGHYPGHLLLWDEPRRTLLTGDHVLGQSYTIPFLFLVDWDRGLRPRSLNLYLDSLHVLERLDVERVLPAHGTFERPLSERIARIRKHHERLRTRLLRLLERGPESAFALVRRTYRHLAESHAFYGLSEVIGNLDHLERAGEVEEVEGPGGEVRFRRTRAATGAPAPPRLRIDREGVVRDDGAEVTHAGTVEMIFRGLERDPGGGYRVRAGHDLAVIAVDDVPFVVERLVEEDGRFRMLLPGGLWEDLDPDSLAVGPDHAFRTTVRGGCGARFGRAAHYQLAEHVVEDAGGGFALQTPDGARHPVRVEGASSGGSVPS